MTDGRWNMSYFGTFNSAGLNLRVLLVLLSAMHGIYSHKLHCKFAYRILTFLIVAIFFLVMLAILLSAKLLEPINALLRPGHFNKLNYSTKTTN